MMSHNNLTPTQLLKARLLQGELPDSFAAFVVDDFEKRVNDMPPTIEAIEELESLPAPTLEYTFNETRETIIYKLAGGAELRFKPNGFSVTRVRCPFCPKDKSPAASINLETGLYCHRCGKNHNFKDLAHALDIPWRVTPAMDPARLLRSGMLSERPRGIVGMSRETRRAFIRAGLTNLARALDVLTHHERGGEIATLREYSACLSPYLSGKAIRTTFEQLQGKNLPKTGEGEFLPEIFPYSCLPLIGKKTGKNSPHRKTDRPEGRPQATIRIPTLEEITRAAQVIPQTYYSMDPDTIRSAAEYRAEALADQLRNRPGKYALKLLTSWVGVSAPTVRRYAERRGIVRTPQPPKLSELTPAEVLELPEEYTGKRFLQDERGKRYRYTKAGARRAADAGGGKLYRAEYQASDYRPS